MVWSLVLRPNDAKQDPVVYDAEFGLVFLAEGPTYCFHTGAPRLPRPVYHSGLEGERYFRLVVELT